MPPDDMEEPQTAEVLAQHACQGRRVVGEGRRGEIENPYVFEHSNEPDWYKF